MTITEGKALDSSFITELQGIKLSKNQLKAEGILEHIKLHQPIQPHHKPISNK